MFRVALVSLVALQSVQAMPTSVTNALAADTNLLEGNANHTIGAIRTATIKYILEIRGELHTVKELFYKARIGSLEGISKCRKHALNKLTEEIKHNNSAMEMVDMTDILMADATADLVLYDTRDTDTELTSAADASSHHGVDLSDLLKAKSGAVHDIKRMKLDSLEYVKRLKQKSMEAINLAKKRGSEELGLTPIDDSPRKTDAEEKEEAMEKHPGLVLEAEHEKILVNLLKNVNENELLQLLDPAWAAEASRAASASDVSGVPWHSFMGHKTVEQVKAIALAAIKAAKVSSLLELKKVKKNMLEALAEARNNALADVKAFVAKKTPESDE